MVPPVVGSRKRVQEKESKGKVEGGSTEKMEQKTHNQRVRDTEEMVI